MHALAACGSFVAEQQSVRKDPDGLPAVRQLEETGAQAPVFFRLYQSASYSLQNISRCGKFFCVVKNHAARHKNPYCEMGKVVSQCGTIDVSN
jgi:hypothetical protein